MAATVTGGLSRVTVVAPKSRVDLAIPSDVPLADLLPTLLGHLGTDLADSGTAHGGWVLSRLGGQQLDSGRSAAQLEIRDGELLYFTPRSAAAPELVFDDVVDAVATATNERPGRWRPEHTRRAALAAAVATLLGGAVAVLLAGPPQLPPALVALGLSVLLLATAAVLSRALGDSRGGVAFGLVALCYAGVGGLLVAAGGRRLGELSGPHVLIAATALLVAATVAMIGVADAGPVFLAAVMSAGALALAGTVAFLPGVGAAGAAAVAGSAAFAALPVLPMFAYRFARLPVPSVPADAHDLRTDGETVDGVSVLARSARADAYLTGMLGAAALVCAVSCAPLALAGGWPGRALATVLSVLLLIRARLFLTWRARVPALAASAAGLALVTLALFRDSDTLLRLSAILGGLLLAALVATVYGLTDPDRRPSPLWGRLVDVAEIALIVAVVPLAAWVTGAYTAIRAIRG